MNVIIIDTKEHKFIIRIDDYPTGVRDKIDNYRKFADQILNEFEQLYKNQWHSIISNWCNYCIHEDSPVSFHTENGKHEGIFQGISSNGHAKIQINGEIETFPAGRVTL